MNQPKLKRRTSVQVLVTDADVLFNAASSGDLAAALAPFARRLAAGEVSARRIARTHA